MKRNNWIEVGNLLIFSRSTLKVSKRSFLTKSTGLLLVIGCLISSCTPTFDPTAPDGLKFEQVAASETGIFFNSDYTPNFRTYNSGGSGISAGYINSDSLPDLVFSSLGKPRLEIYLNRGGFRFDQITQSSGVDQLHVEMTNLIDLNADGFDDLFVVRHMKTGTPGYNGKGKQSTYFYENDGNGKFIDKTLERQLNLTGYINSVQFFDFDLDGDLDVFLTKETNFQGNLMSFSFYQSPPDDSNDADQLLRNDKGKFVDISREVGLPLEKCLSHTSVVCDLNHDGWPDLYVPGDFFCPDRAYVNNGNGGFEEKHSELFDKNSMFSMGADANDIDNDLMNELLIVDMMPRDRNDRIQNVSTFTSELHSNFNLLGKPQHWRNTLHKSFDGISYSEIGFYAGVAATDWSWSCQFADLDNDGLKDLLVTNGIFRDYANLDYLNKNFGNDPIASYKRGHSMQNPTKDLHLLPRSKSANFLFRNQGNLKFEDLSKVWNFNIPVRSSAGAAVDIDLDGDLDLVINNLDTIPFLFENVQPNSNYLKIRFELDQQNRNGFGYSAIVYSGTLKQMNTISNLRGYKSTGIAELHFGLGEETFIDSILVFGHGELIQRLTKIKANQTVIVEGDNEQDQSSLSYQLPKYSNEIIEIEHSHSENEFNDFKSNRLFYRKYSREGPALAVADVNGDNLDDFYIGGSAGKKGQLYLQTQIGAFEKCKNNWGETQELEETDAAFTDIDADGDFDLYICSGSSEFQQGSPFLQDVIYINDGTGKFSLAVERLPEMLTFSSCVEPVDFEGDGDVDFFVGGRMDLDRYPNSPRSYLLINENGFYQDYTDSLALPLKFPGMVTDAVWTDFNEDGHTDLVVVGEWMPIRFFSNAAGKLTEAKMNGLPIKTHGLWNSIERVDFNGNSKFDLVLGNWGQNSQFDLEKPPKLKLISADFDQNGRHEPLIFQKVSDQWKPMHSKDDFCQQMPKFNNQFITYSKYAQASIDSIIVESMLDTLDTYEASEFRSVVLSSCGKSCFSLSPLPSVCQTSPVFASCHADLNADGLIDLIFGGNLNGNHFEHGAINASRGHVLFGDSSGQFTMAQVEHMSMKGDIRKIRPITIQGTKHLLFAKNSMPHSVSILRTE